MHYALGLDVTSWNVIALFIAIPALVVLAFASKFLSLWWMTRLSDAPIGLFHLVAMRFRKIDPRIIVISHIRSVRSGVNVPIERMEAHYLAGGNVHAVVTAMIAADRRDVPLTWETACELDLSGEDVVEAVNHAIDSGAAISDPRGRLAG